MPTDIMVVALAISTLAWLELEACIELAGTIDAGVAAFDHLTTLNNNPRVVLVQCFPLAAPSGLAIF